MKRILFIALAAAFLVCGFWQTGFAEPTWIPQISTGAKIKTSYGVGAVAGGGRNGRDRDRVWQRDYV